MIHPARALAIGLLLLSGCTMVQPGAGVPAEPDVPRGWSGSGTPFDPAAPDAATAATPQVAGGQRFGGTTPSALGGPIGIAIATVASWALSRVMAMPYAFDPADAAGPPRLAPGDPPMSLTLTRSAPSLAPAPAPAPAWSARLQTGPPRPEPLRPGPVHIAHITHFAPAALAEPPHAHAPAPWHPPPCGDTAFLALQPAYRSQGGIARGDALAPCLALTGLGGYVELARRLVAGQLFSFRWQDSFWVPMFQFDVLTHALRDAPRQVLGELQGVLDGWGLAHWHVQPHARLGGQRPIDLLESDLPAVHAAARADRLALSA